MKIEVSRVIDRPPDVVFGFVAVDHVRNHPRWDPAMELEQLTPGPIRNGTILRRRHTRAGAPIEGTMEVVEWEPPNRLAWLVHDGPVEMLGRTTIEPEGDDASRMTITVDIPGNPDPLDPLPVETSISRMKAMIESETPTAAGGLAP